MLVDHQGSVELFPLASPQHYSEGPREGPPPSQEMMAQPPVDRQSSDILTYSQYVNGSIFSIPQSWSQKSTDEMLMTVYSFVKSFW